METIIGAFLNNISAKKPEALDQLIFSPKWISALVLFNLSLLKWSKWNNSLQCPLNSLINALFIYLMNYLGGNI